MIRLPTTNPNNARNGISNGRTKLTEAQVRAMRAEWIPNKVTIPELRQKYAPNVSKTSVAKAIAGLTWKHLK